MLGVDGIFFFKQKTADEMRISDWSSDVCSSDLRVQHAHDFGTLLVHGQGVEIVDLAVFRWPHRMRQRAGILGELARAQQPHILDPLDRTRVGIGGELLIAEHGEPFLERELKPAIGRASCRERVGQYVWIWVVAGSVKKKKK